MAKISDADVITTVQQLRRMITIFDSFGCPIKTFMEDDELVRVVPDDLPNKIINVSRTIHHMLVEFEKHPRYKMAVKTMLELKGRG